MPERETADPKRGTPPGPPLLRLTPGRICRQKPHHRRWEGSSLSDRGHGSDPPPGRIWRQKAYHRRWEGSSLWFAGFIMRELPGRQPLWRRWRGPRRPLPPVPHLLYRQELRRHRLPPNGGPSVDSSPETPGAGPQLAGGRAIRPVHSVRMVSTGSALASPVNAITVSLRWRRHRQRRR